MANVKISQLPSLSTMTDLAQIPVVAGGTTYQITGANLSSYFSTSSAGSKIVNGSTEANIGVAGGNANISVGGISNVAVFTQSGVIISGVLTAPVLTTNNIRSDDSSFVNIEDGVNVTGAVVVSGNVNVGGAVANVGNLSLAAGANAWVFGTDGVLTLAGGATLKEGVALGALAFGYQAGQTSQGIRTVAIGQSAGQTSQGARAVAVGLQAGQTSQGGAAVAVGAFAGATSQGTNSIIINATGANLDQTTANTFTVAPVRNDVANTANVMFYNATSNEITYGNTINVAGNIGAGNVNVTTATGNLVFGRASATGSPGINSTSSVTVVSDRFGTPKEWVFGTDGSFTGLGNISGGNVNTGVVANTGNLSLTSGANSWTFDTTGNLTVPSCIILPPNALITSVGASPAPRLNNFDSVSAVNLSASGNVTSVTVSASGNITGGNLNAAGLSLSGNVVSALNASSSIAAGTTISAVGNITGGNILGGANVNATTHTGTTVSVTGNITGGNLTITGNTATITSANYQIGYLEIPQISFAANTTANLTVSGKHYYSTSASNLALTIANNTSVVWPVGTAISIVNRGTANITVAGDTGVSLYLAGNATAGNRIVTTYGMATVMNVAANVWMISGTVV